MRRPGSDPGRVDVRFLVDKLAHRQVFLDVVCFTPSVLFRQRTALAFILIQYYSYQKDKEKRAKSW